MSVIKSDLENIKYQFISLDELLNLLCESENATQEEVAQWLTSKIQILRRTKQLVLHNSYTLVEYVASKEDYYNSPIDSIRLVAHGEELGLKTDMIGFARLRLLIDLKREGINIDEKLINESVAYVSDVSKEDDDNFYKNQCIDLIEETYSIKALPNEHTTQTDKINPTYLKFLDKRSPHYVAKFDVLFRTHLEMNFVGKYSNESVKLNRIKMLLDDFGHDYGYSATETHAKNLAQLLPNRKDSVICAREAVSKAMEKE